MKPLKPHAKEKFLAEIYQIDFGKMVRKAVRQGVKGIKAKAKKP